jgi:isoleucyl-tRNA synthetase
MILCSAILPFTTEEVFQYMNEGESVHLQEINLNELRSMIDFSLDYSGLDDLLREGRLQIESLKQNGQINRNGDLTVCCSNEFLGDLASLILGTSLEYKLIEKKMEIKVSDFPLCQRCLKRNSLIENDQQICQRCFNYLKEVND